jgi:predicted enzyme related to lactoylglutathione lyase
MHGKICYIEIPTGNVKRSEEFYASVFNWTTRRRTDGSVAFDDPSGAVSGTWKEDRKATSDIGSLVYIMVDDAKETIQKIKSNGGKIIQEIGADYPEITARFEDPFGNIFGIYQE